MNTNIQEELEVTAEAFHQAIHREVDLHGKKTHGAMWVDSRVFLKEQKIDISLYVDLKTPNLDTHRANKLRFLVRRGVAQYWSRDISVAETPFKVSVSTVERRHQAIVARLVDKPNEKAGRSHNSGVWRAKLIHNEKFFRSLNPLQPDSPHYAEQNRKLIEYSDADFMMTAAHELGHSVLHYAGGIGLSWKHKGSTHLTQSVKTRSPAYPEHGEIDLMRYYNKNEKVLLKDILKRTVVAEIDVKRLIWASKCQFMP